MEHLANKQQALVIKAFYKATMTMPINGYFDGVSKQTAITLCNQLTP
jgi:hypothetical protein